MNASVEFQFGNKQIKIIVNESHSWVKENHSRTYFDFEVIGKANPLRSLYEIHEGSTRDETIEVNGRKFGFDFGFCASGRKRDAVREAVNSLILQIVE